MWRYEHFYYGNASWPAYTDWRVGAGEWQQQVEIDRVAHAEDGAVLWTYYIDRGWIDPEVVWYGHGGGYYLHAWVPATKTEYENAKRGAWAMPDGTYRVPEILRHTQTWNLTALGLDKGPFVS